MGDVPLEWYKHEEHIGYDKDGSRLIKKDQRDKLDQLLDRNDAERWRTVYDEYNDEEVCRAEPTQRGGEGGGGRGGGC